MATTGSALCLDCRALLARASCDEAGHRAVSLEDPDGRARLASAVWGTRSVVVPRPWLERYRWVFWRAGLGTFATLIACLPFSACTDHPLDELVSVRMWAFIALMLAIVVPALLVEGWGEHRAERLATETVEVDDAEPRTVPPRAPDADGLTGVVASADSERSPLRGLPCAAWAVWLGRGEGILFRVAQSAELEVRLDDGQRLRVPAGRVRFDERLPRNPVELDLAEAFLARLGVPRGQGREDPFPCSEAWEAALASGDRVAVFGELDRQPVEGHGPEPYRAEPEHELVSRGVPTLRPLPTGS